MVFTHRRHLHHKLSKLETRKPSRYNHGVGKSLIPVIHTTRGFHMLSRDRRLTTLRVGDFHWLSLNVEILKAMCQRLSKRNQLSGLLVREDGPAQFVAFLLTQ